MSVAPSPIMTTLYIMGERKKQMLFWCNSVDTKQANHNSNNNNDVAEDNLHFVLLFQLGHHLLLPTRLAGRLILIKANVVTYNNEQCTCTCMSMT